MIETPSMIFKTFRIRTQKSTQINHVSLSTSSWTDKHEVLCTSQHMQAQNLDQIDCMTVELKGALLE